jgi:LysR family glycine cleavage system transcriptional activator
MAYRLPPLNALRVVEAAGRHVSFTRAAEELNVTPGAVSRQVKLLEEVLGIDLFERNSRELRLTPESRTYIEALTDAFERLGGATRQFVHEHRARSLNVHCGMTFALRWLVPRLATFHTLHPKQDIRVTTAMMPVALQVESGDIDIMIKLGDGSWPNLVNYRLVDSELVPVCSPSLAATLSPSNGIDQLANQTLLHSLAAPNDWARWANAVHAADLDTDCGIRFESSILAYQAAIEGIGVAIAQRCLIQSDLDAGRLVMPFDFAHKDGNGFFLIHTPTTERESRLVEFRDWLLADSRSR